MPLLTRKLSSESIELGNQLIKDIVSAIEKSPQEQQDKKITELLDLIKNYRVTDNDYAQFILSGLKENIKNKKLQEFNL